MVAAMAILVNMMCGFWFVVVARAVREGRDDKGDKETELEVVCGVLLMLSDLWIDWYCICCGAGWSKRAYWGVSQKEAMLRLTLSLADQQSHLRGMYVCGSIYAYSLQEATALLYLHGAAPKHRPIRQVLQIWS